jgi:16S rRNA (adenine1518-N6/adenine1519-N6)-dimethyltransferase
MKADKSLGQHFLRDADVLADIVAVADLDHSAGALEIGPGEGALTAFLARTSAPLTAIDQDPRAVETIRTRFGARIEVTLGDATRADLGALLPPARGNLRPVVVGNLPYNAASLIHRRVLGLGDRIARAVLMFQKEVALRLVARPSTADYGIPSILTQVTARAWVVREVPPEAFSPRPKVDSAVVLVEPLGVPVVAPADLDRFGDFLGNGFRQRRKTLANALGEQRRLLDVVGVDPRKRAEELDPATWVALWRASIGG